MRLATGRFSARTYLLGLIAVAVIPVWLLAAYLLVSLALSQQQDYRDLAVQIARQSAFAVEGELGDMLVRLDGLARSIDPERPDLRKLNEDARRLIEGTGQVVLLRGFDGNQLLNTRYDFGSELPGAVPLSDAERGDFDAGRPRVSDVYRAPDSEEPRISVARPITNGGTTLLLAMTAPTSTFARVLSTSVSPGWVVGVGDRGGVYVTRSERHDEVTGKPGLPQYLEKAVGTSGTFTAKNQFGDTLLAGYFRSDFTGWLYGANVSLAAVEAPLWSSIYGVLGTAALALLVSMALAYFVGKTITNETSGLVRGAIALGARQPVLPLKTRLVEYALVSDALVSAEKMLHERTQELEAVLETAPVAVWFTYDPTAREVIRNRYAAELMGLPAGDRTRFGVPDRVIDTIAIKDGRPVSRADRPLTKAMRGEKTDQEEYAYVLLDGEERSLLTSARPIVDHAGAIVGAVQVSVDITERRRSEEQRKLLTNELNHRVKNNLAIVQALAQQTLRSSANLAEAGVALSARLAALGEAHEILTRNSWKEGQLRDVIDVCVAAHAPAGRIELNGTDLTIPSKVVMALTLALHELTTNAIKYGAWSNESGRVSISWKLSDEPRSLTLAWKERGGPPVSKPSRDGFGTRLLERVAAGEGGAVKTSFDENGLVAEITLPLPATT